MQCCSVKRLLPPGIEIPGYRRPSHPGLPLEPRHGAAVGSPGFQSRAGEGADVPEEAMSTVSEPVWVLMRALALLMILLAGPAAADTLGLAWGAVAEPATAGALTPGQVAEHLEFLQAHGWRTVRASSLDAAGGGKGVLLSFDDPASALRYAVPLLALYRMPAVVTVGPAQAADPALVPVLKELAASPWIELVPRVEAEPADASTVRCEPDGGAAGRETERLSRLSKTLTDELARLRQVAGVTPSAVAWAPGAWSGSGEAVAGSLGLKVQLPAFTGMPPVLDGPRVARYVVPSWAGVWALVQASVHWDPQDHPVRFVEVDASWICAGGDPEARVARMVEVVNRLGLNGARVLPGNPIRVGVIGPLVRALREAGVRWVMADLPPDVGRDVAQAADLARAADWDVVMLPPGPADRRAEAVRYVRPAARLAWLEEGNGRAFRIDPWVPGQAPARGLTVSAATVAAANAEAARATVAGQEWIGLPVELAEAGLRSSSRSLAAFVLAR
jgi:hypothetical protein